MILMQTACAPAPTPLPPAPVTPTASPAPTLTPLPTATATPLPSPTPTPVILVCSPLAGHPLDELPQIITESFSMPRPGRDDAHHGVDLGYWSWNGKKLAGTPVLAALDGQVAAVIDNRDPYGNMLMTETVYSHIPPALLQQVEIPTGQSLYLVYAHLEQPSSFKIGETVTCGQTIGAAGLSGRTSGPHLHFEARWGPPGTTFDSMAYYTTAATPEEMQAYETWRMSGTYQLFDPMLLLSLPQP